MLANCLVTSKKVSFTVRLATIASVTLKNTENINSYHLIKYLHTVLIEGRYSLNCQINILCKDGLLC